MIKRLATVGIVAVATIAAFTSAFASHSWNNYHWARTDNPFTLRVVDSVSAEWESTFVEALARWDQSNVFTLSVVAVQNDSRTRKRCASVPGQMRVCNAAYGNNGWLGLATIGLDNNGHIDRGTAKMNDSYSWYWTEEEMNHVMCQEIGHVFGLGHTSEDGTSQNTCMDYSTSPTSQWPNSHDYQQLASIYSHVDSYNSYDDGSGGGGKPCHGKKCPNGAGLGLLPDGQPPMGVRVHQGRGHELWVASRPDGGLWIHHVYLVPGEDDGHAH